jgi:class 3 adenylate cyclase
MERRLAAILAADVVGYSRLMGADEEGTLVRLKAHRDEITDPAIAKHKGRIVKLMGDAACWPSSRASSTLFAARPTSLPRDPSRSDRRRQ